MVHAREKRIRVAAAWLVVTVTVAAGSACSSSSGTTDQPSATPPSSTTATTAAPPDPAAAYTAADPFECPTTSQSLTAALGRTMTLVDTDPLSCVFSAQVPHTFESNDGTTHLYRVIYNQDLGSSAEEVRSGFEAEPGCIRSFRDVPEYGSGAFIWFCSDRVVALTFNSSDGKAAWTLTVAVDSDVQPASGSIEADLALVYAAVGS